MKASEFKDCIRSIERMSRNQQDKLRERLEGRAGADTIIELIEQGQNDKRICPYYQETKLYRWGKASEIQRYRCRRCNHTFNALTGTALVGLRHKDKWFDYEQAMVQGLSVRKAAISCGITKNTSFKWRHRFLQVPAIHQSNKMNGIVEADEMYFLESFKGQRHLLSEDVIFCTDGRPAYRQITRNAKIVHRPVNIAAGQRVINDVYHIQNVNAYGSRLRQWMAKFHGVATRYLASYLGWHRMIDRLGQNVTPTLCFLMSLGKTRQFQQLITT